ncbi:Radical SAM superfamily enzyme YgiQ, UPF0313 family [Actinopolyspora xinjiangensis]|uniref:Radical SAM superfamily enzyme YgiQ, UPF0313 family n=1 Tax=Actinopolyspora xinjiangensis TaxID=405564 RepID=A0A1H0VE83_9ACTN|nr:CUAEP/CCAEP-tail radical SAM protein [Actinopolyspora xinjiangensis]SDP76525.1 Radical SAM superfamily enzyme YgiQ, UPF0313 family [Actinopolyspora xinjiangensis]
MQVVLLSTYEIGRQPFGLASPAAWLRRAGHSVHCVDLSTQKLEGNTVREADLIACYAPMHTATRLANTVIQKLVSLNPEAHLCFYGLYAPMNEDYLRSLGVQTILGGEFEQGLCDLVERLARDDAAGRDPTSQIEPRVSLERQEFVTPDRGVLPALDHYAHFIDSAGQARTVGYTEATRGCKHTCRHCPIVPVYGGRFRVVQQQVVLDDIDNLVRTGAEHITFGDPDFLNAPGHARKLVEALHSRHPDITYDVTIKVEHLVKHAQLLPTLAETNCALVTCAVESFDEHALEVLDKQHSPQDFEYALEQLRAAGIALNPTFVAFMPYVSLEGYLDFLRTLHRLDLVGNVAPVQYAIRLLIPRGSLLLDRPETQAVIGEFDEEALCYPWTHPDPRMDQLHTDVSDYVERVQNSEVSRAEIFRNVLTLAHRAAGLPAPSAAEFPTDEPDLAPHVDEPWYCCAEPTTNQLLQLEVGV